MSYRSTLNSPGAATPKPHYSADARPQVSCYQGRPGRPVAQPLVPDFDPDLNRPRAFAAPAPAARVKERASALSHYLSLRRELKLLLKPLAELEAQYGFTPETRA